MEFEHNEVKTPDGLSDHLSHSCMSFCASVDLEAIHFNYSVECRPLCRSVKMAYGKKKRVIRSSTLEESGQMEIGEKKKKLVCNCCLENE